MIKIEKNKPIQKRSESWDKLSEMEVGDSFLMSCNPSQRGSLYSRLKTESAKRYLGYKYATKWEAESGGYRVWRTA